MVNVVIISQNEAFRTDLESQITQALENYVCDKNACPDIIVLDEQVSRVDELRNIYERVPIFVLQKKKEKKCVQTPFLKYIQKPFALNVLLDMLQSALNIIARSQSGILRFNGYELSSFEKEIKNLQTGEKIKLTEREVSMLLYLYKQRGKAISKADFLQEVWGYSPDTSTHTIETHVYRLRQKVEKNESSCPLISTENGGYRLNF